MACQLYTQDDLTALYSVVYGEILDRIKDPSLGKFDQKAFDSLVKKIYNELKDNPDNALIYAQAVPDIFNLVSNDPEIKKYLVKEVKFDFNYPNEKSLDFEDLEEVKKFVTGKKRVQRTKKDIQSDIKKANKAKNDVVQDNTDKNSISALEENDKAKIDYATKTTSQIAIAKNPTTLTEAERNLIDNQKELFSKVIKSVAWAAKNREENEDITLDGRSVAIKVQRLSDLDKEDITESDSKFLSGNKNYPLLVAIIADENGDPIRFDENGNVSTDGRIVYQFIRPTIKSDNKLFLGNTSGYKYTLVPAYTLAKREIAQTMAESGEIMDEDERKAVVARIKRNQQQSLNDLYRLNERFKNDSTPVLLPITGGSYGIVEKKSALLSDTPFADKVNMVYIHNAGESDGGSYFILYDEAGSLTPNGRIYLQRMDINEDIARNIAKVLTTDLLKDGEKLAPQERLSYYSKFLSNTTKNNNMKVKIENILNEDRLVISLYNPITKETINPLDDPATAEDVIFEHLMTANKKPDSAKIFPASMSYMDLAKKGVIQKGNRFTDYEFTTKNGKTIIKEVSKDYFEFIKPFMKVDYTVGEGVKYAEGLNPYLDFAIPDEFSTPEEDLIAIGAIKSTNLKDKSVDNGDKKTKKRTTSSKKKATDSKKSKLEVFQSNLTQDKALTANVNEAGIVLGIGTDFETKDEKHVLDKAGRSKKWSGFNLGKKGKGKKLDITENVISKLVKELSDIDAKNKIVNIVGNDLGALTKAGYTQKEIDEIVYDILSKVVKEFPIDGIITHGQTGVSEAAIKAAMKLNIPVKIRAFSKFAIRVPAKNKYGYTSVPNSKTSFLKRFYAKDDANLQELELEEEAVTEKPVEVPKAEPVAEQTEEEKEEVTKKINKTSIDDLLGGDDLGFKAPTRNKRAAAFMDQMFGNRENWQEVQKWWDKSPLKNIVSLERMTAVINSDAYGRFLTSGALLAEVADKLRKDGFLAKIELYGDALPITLYHEAWHAFSQLVLTLQEKTDLYNTLASKDQWKGKSFIEIEEDLAEGFIDYVAEGKKPESFIEKVYKKIKAIIDFFFGKSSNRDLTRIYDIPAVKEYYEKLYTGKFEINVENATDNLMEGFQKLNSSKKIIQPITKEAKDYLSFTDIESDKAVDILDSLMARAFYTYNSRFNTTSGAVTLLTDINSREKLYGTIEKQLDKLLQANIDKLNKITQDNLTSETPDVIGEQRAQARVDLLVKMTQNYGDIARSLTKKTNKGVVAFHIEKSRFSVLKEQYIDDIEDPTTQLFTTKESNAVSAKQLATQDTMMMLSGIYKMEKDSKGNYIKKTDEEGISSYVVQEDEFGLPVLESVDVMWNRLARTLQGSLDYTEMYDRISKSIANYPEFIQVLESLPNPYLQAPGSYHTNTEFRTETGFWQDFKKPVIPYIQFNVNKETLSKPVFKNGKKVADAKIKYESRVARANFDIYKILNDWRSNFLVADPSVNPYIKVQTGDYNINILDIDKLMADISKDKKLIPEKANDFLRALGIVLDTGSAEIKNVIENKKFPFIARYNIEQIYSTMRLVYLANRNEDEGLKNAAKKVLENPLQYLMNGLPAVIEKAAGGRKTDVSSRIRTLAELQNRFSDGYSNYSVLTPEKNKVWEQFMDNTVTRIITSINLAKNWQELTRDEADPNGRFQHMRFLAEENNPASQFSVMLKSMFDLDPMSDTYGEKLPEAKFLLENIGGTQIIDKATGESIGTSTASTDVVSKFIQELHTMLQSGVQEFMRHASKQTAMNVRASELDTYSGKSTKNLYVDIMAFSPTQMYGTTTFGENKAFDIVLGYIAAEGGRIFRYLSNKEEFSNWAGYNRKVKRKDTGKVVDAGEAFTAFDDVLSPETQEKLYDIINNSIGESTEDFNLKDIINDNETLRAEVKQDVIKYFDKQSVLNYNRLQKNKYVDQSLYDMIDASQLSKDQIDKMLVKAYTYNSWIHNFETTILAYGDMVQYNHDKEEFHKRNAGLGSGGRGFRSDFRARAYINSPMNKQLWAEKNGFDPISYDGTLNTAIISEVTIPKSVYYDEYREKHVANYTERYLKAGKSKKDATRLANELADIVLDEYNKMKIGDGQGWVGFEAYRMLKKLEDNWSPAQEELYKKVVNGEQLLPSEITEYFPPYKLQYYGHIKTEGLGLVSFHKFSLAPIVPSAVIEDTQLGQLHRMMSEQNVQYVLMPTGSKVGHIGNGDNVFNEDGSIDRTKTLTKNTIFVEYLKNQTQINPSYKTKSIFSTQMRKLILEGLYEQGIVNKEAKALIDTYVNRVSDYTDLLKEELLNEIGFAQDANGEYNPVDKDSVAKLAKLIRDNLTRDDVISDNLIDVIDVTEDGSLRFDLSLHPEAAKIEKLILSLVNKRIIKQKVKGEPLVQLSSALYNGLVKFDFTKTKAGRDEAIKKYMGSNFLPTYHEKEDGNTAAMKVAIALQGDYESLLNLEYKGKVIGNLETLNEAIKDDEWLDADDGNNRKAITMVGVRIPVQGLNSMEFMEVYHFLPAEAGNVIIPPAEIVAKSGADFDIDKLSIFMNNINAEGLVSQPLYENFEKFKEALDNNDLGSLTKAQMFAAQKAGMENQLINDIRNILELPENFVSLTAPNGTYLVKPIADKLAASVMEYNPFQNMMSEESNKSEKDKTVISPTRVFEVGYNLYKHESNVVGKRTLGLGAIENTFNVIFNSLGAYMPAVYKHNDQERISSLALRHNTMKREGQEVISLSNQYDVDGINKIADIYSQMINGWVDVEKDAWIFFIQGNYEVAPILMYLVKAGVPVKEAIYFVSQPLVREYVEEKRISQSTYAEPLRKLPGGGVNYSAATNIIAKHFPKMIEKDSARYEAGQMLMDKFFEKRKDKHFTEAEMLKLIEDSATKPEAANSFLSRTMFLHYLTIEQQIQGLTELKMASNPDTTTMTDVGQAFQAKEKWNKLVEQTKIPSSLREGMRNDSILRSFFNYDLVEGLSKPLFTFRYDEAIQAQIDFILNDLENIKYLKTVFGNDYRDRFSATFRNDVLSYLFQNALRKYQISDNYSSFILNENVSLESAKLNFGVQFVEGKEGPKMLVDNIQLEREYLRKAYLKGSDAKNSYEDRGLYPLSPGHFDSNSSASKSQYIRFVMEREYLRHVYPVDEVNKSKKFKEEYAEAKTQKIKETDAENMRYAYEKIIAEKALDNILNPYHLFKDKESAYAVRLEKLKLKYSDSFINDYKVLSYLKLDSNSDRNMFNIYLNDKDMDTYKANLYSNQLARLADRNVKKVEDIEENNEISDFFSKMTYVAMMQTGTNKSKFNFLNITDFDKFLSIMDSEVAKFTESPAKAKMITDFTKAFYRENSTANYNKGRFKDYLTSFDVAKAESESATAESETTAEQKEVKPENISSKGSEFGKKLTNPGNDLTVEYKGRLFRNAEHAYQTYKSGEFDEAAYKSKAFKPVGSKPANKKTNYATMVEILVAKLTQHPELISGINERGGLAYIQQSTHNVVGDAYWESSGQNKFIEALADAYKLVKSPSSIATEDTKSETLTKRKNLLETDRPDVFIYNDLSGTDKVYQYIVDNNPDVTFVYGFSLLEKQKLDAATPASLKKMKLSDQAQLRKIAGNSSIGLLIGQDNVRDSFSKLDPKYYQGVKNLIEAQIKEINDAIEAGNKVAFSIDGYGDPNTMPKEIFDYLSRRLFEDFGYLNPGAGFSKVVSEEVSKYQPITDTEILAKFEGMNDPLMC